MARREPHEKVQSTVLTHVLPLLHWQRSPLYCKVPSTFSPPRAHGTRRGKPLSVSGPFHVQMAEALLSKSLNFQGNDLKPDSEAI